MNKSHYKLYKKSKKWVIAAVAATSIGVGGYTLNNLKVHADAGQLAGLSLQPVINDSEFYKMADSLSIAAKNNSITDEKQNYESFKAALAAYEIIKETHSIMCNDLSILSKSHTGIPYYLTENQLDSLKTRFNDINSSMMDAYYHHDNTRVLNGAYDYVNAASNITRMYGSITMYGNTTLKPIDSSVSSVGSLSSKYRIVADSASSAISSVIGSYNAYKNGVRAISQSSSASSLPSSDNMSNSKTSNEDSYWKNVANSLSAEMNKRNNNDHSIEQTAAPVSHSNFVESSAATSTSLVSASSAISSAATSYSSSDSSIYTPITSSSATNKSNNGSKNNSNDMYKNLYLDLKKKAAKDISSNRYKVAKYKKEYKVTKNKQKRANKLKKYRDAKNKLNASKKHFKDLNAKLLKY